MHDEPPTVCASILILCELRAIRRDDRSGWRAASVNRLALYQFFLVSMDHGSADDIPGWIGPAAIAAVHTAH